MDLRDSLVNLLIGKRYYVFWFVELIESSNVYFVIVDGGKNVSDGMVEWNVGINI